MVAEYDGAIECYVDRTRVFIGQNTHKAIVVHGTGGSPGQTAQQLGEWFNTNANETSVHFGIDRSGVIAQYVRLEDGAGGNGIVEAGYDPFWQSYIQTYGNLNICTISIEHTNDLNNSLPLTDVQKAASFKLVWWLCQRFNIAADHVKTHASIAPLTRARCPGVAFPYNELITFLGQGETPMGGIPARWTDNGHELRAPDGKFPVVLGFRDYILSHTWDAGDYPIEAEHHQDPLEISHVGLGAGQQQLFMMSMLGYTLDRGVFKEYVGVELQALRSQKKG